MKLTKEEEIKIIRDRITIVIPEFLSSGGGMGGPGYFYPDKIGKTVIDPDNLAEFLYELHALIENLEFNLDKTHKKNDFMPAPLTDYQSSLPGGGGNPNQSLDDENEPRGSAGGWHGIMPGSSGGQRGKRD